MLIQAPPHSRPLGKDIPDINRGLVLVDGDNVHTTLGRAYGHWPYLDEMRDLLAKPDCVGIDRIVGFVHYLSVKNFNRLERVKLPYSPRDDVTVRLYPIEWGHGYPDSAIFKEALRRRSEYDTLVLVSSDHDFLRFAKEMRRGYDRYSGKQHPEWAREVVSILSPMKAKYGWERQATNYELLKHLVPDLARPGRVPSMAG